MTGIVKQFNPRAKNSKGIVFVNDVISKNIIRHFTFNFLRKIFGTYLYSYENNNVFTEVYRLEIFFRVKWVELFKLKIFFSIF